MEIPPIQSYKLLSPRIVILVTTVDEKGRINAAPYSFCGPLEFDPPLVYFAARPFQDTYKNVKKTKEFVINIVDESFAQKAVTCEERCPPGVNELEKVGLHWYDSERVKPPRVKEAKVHLECKLVKKVEVGNHKMLIGEVVSADAEGVKSNYNPDFKKLKSIMQSSGEDFYSIGKEVKLKRGY